MDFILTALIAAIIGFVRCCMGFVLTALIAAIIGFVIGFVVSLYFYSRAMAIFFSSRNDEDILKEVHSWTKRK